MTRVPGDSRTISRVASIPFRSGMLTSMSTTLGESSRVKLQAEWPSVAWPTTSISSCCWMERAKP